MRHFESFAVFEDGKVRVISGHGHVERVGDSHAGRLIFKNRVDKIAAEVSVRSSVASCGDGRRQRGFFDRVSERLDDLYRVGNAGKGFFNGTISRVKSAEFTADASRFEIDSVTMATHHARDPFFFRSK